MWPLLTLTHYGKRELVFCGAICNQETSYLDRGAGYQFTQIHAIVWQVSHSCVCHLH